MDLRHDTCRPCIQASLAGNDLIEIAGVIYTVVDDVEDEWNAGFGVDCVDVGHTPLNIIDFED